MLPLLCPDDKGRARFDCAACGPRMGEDVLRSMHCDRVPEREWTGELQPTLGIDGYVAQVDGVCPGAAAHRQSVIEAAQAYAAFKVGQLDVTFPDPDQSVVEGALLMQSAFSRYEAAQLKAKP